MFPSERRSFLLFLKRLVALSLLLCVAAAAQTPAPSIPADVAERVQRQVRAYFNIPPDVTITLGTPTVSEFPNYELVPVTMSRQGKTQKADFLLSKDGKTLIRFTKLDLTKDIYAETMNKITLTDRPVRGNPEAKVTIVNFDDFECPFCARMHSTLMSEIMPQYGDKIKIVYKDYPLLAIHPWAQHAANDANCLAKESTPAYWQLADYLHANQRTISGSQQNSQAAFTELDRLTLDFGKKNGADLTKLQACIKTQSDTAVKASIAEGDALGVNATPTVFINGERLEGALDADEVRAALNRQLLSAGVQPPPPLPAAPPASPATPASASPGMPGK
jgi:protein-disulfide isomerase